MVEHPSNGPAWKIHKKWLAFSKTICENAGRSFCSWQIPGRAIHSFQPPIDRAGLNGVNGHFGFKSCAEVGYA
jgi:hypothetical protein